MKNLILALSILTVSSLAYAADGDTDIEFCDSVRSEAAEDCSSEIRLESFKYTCKLMSDYSVTEKIEVSANQMRMFDLAGNGKLRTTILKNNGVKGGKGKMKDRISFTVDYEATKNFPEEISEFLLTPELLTGGMKLRNGSKGGFMSFAGHGYSWESYICFKSGKK